jgi:transcriptional regulator with XRE-family HTH domain
MSTEVSASPSAAATSRQLLGEVFGSFIRFFRETHSRSVEEAARRARMTPERWQAAEDGQVPRTGRQLKAMALATDVSWEEMMRFVDLCRNAWGSRGPRF